MALSWLCSNPHVQCCASDMAIFGFLSWVKRKKRNASHTRLAEERLDPLSLQPLPTVAPLGEGSRPLCILHPLPPSFSLCSGQSVGLTHSSLYTELGKCGDK